MMVTHNGSESYIYLIGDIPAAAAVRQVVVPGGDIILDFDAAGHLLGVELLDSKLLHPVLLARAEIEP